MKRKREAKKAAKLKAQQEAEEKAALEVKNGE